MTEEKSNEPAWYCVRTETKREHIAAEHLKVLEGVEVYCPRLRYRKATRRGKIWWVEPLFPGYVMARFVLAEMDRAVTFTHGVRGLVRFGSEVPPVPDSFVEALQQEILRRPDADEESGVFTVSPVIQVGDEVEVANGPLRGMRGSIVSVAPAAERVKVLLDFLGQPQPVDMDLFSLLLPRRPQP
jgi:transcriptional antiterminator RfaH